MTDAASHKGGVAGDDGLELVSLSPTFWGAIRDGLPLAVSVFAYGLAYGALAHSSNHLTLWQTLSLSVFVFAGASQFTILDLLHQGAGVYAIVSSVLFLNARQILYGLTLGPTLRGQRKWRLAFLAHGLTDESYSITIVQTGRGKSVTARYFLGAGTSVFVPWFIASAVGFAIGSFLQNPAKFGLDFAFVGAFLGLLLAQIKHRRQVYVALCAAVAATVVDHWLGTSGAVFAGALTAFLWGVCRP